MTDFLNHMERAIALAHRIETESMGPPCSASVEDWVRWGEASLGIVAQYDVRSMLADMVEAISQQGCESMTIAHVILTELDKPIQPAAAVDPYEGVLATLGSIDDALTTWNSSTGWAYGIEHLRHQVRRLVQAVESTIRITTKEQT